MSGHAAALPTMPRNSRRVISTPGLRRPHRTLSNWPSERAGNGSLLQLLVRDSVRYGSIATGLSHQQVKPCTLCPESRRAIAPQRNDAKGQQETSSHCNNLTVYSITSSARASNLAGNSVPSASSGFQVDNELQLGGSLHWKFGGVCSFQNLTGVNADLTIRIGNTRSVIHEATGRRKFPPRINSRDFVDLR